MRIYLIYAVVVVEFIIININFHFHIKYLKQCFDNIKSYYSFFLLLLLISSSLFLFHNLI
jgi:hypothetical protein